MYHILISEVGQELMNKQNVILSLVRLPPTGYIRFAQFGVVPTQWRYRMFFFLMFQGPGVGRCCH